MTPTATAMPHPLPPRPGESGTAFLLALIAVVVLTLLGLSLSLTTQTEMSLGDRERSQQRVFYAAEAGFSPAVARALLDHDYTPHQFSVPEVSALGLHDEVAVSSFFPVLAVPCDLCEVHNIAVYNGQQYYEVTHAVSSRGERLGNGGEASGPIAEKGLSVMVDVQPTEISAETFYTVMNQEALHDFPQ